MKKTTLLLVIALLLFPVVSFAEDGAAIFKAKCQMCHGPDGAKMAKANLSGAAIQGKPDAELVTFLTTNTAHKPRAGNEANAKALVAFIRTLKK
jgi:mono/diheme cytochrome c family protein